MASMIALSVRIVCFCRIILKVWWFQECLLKLQWILVIGTPGVGGVGWVGSRDAADARVRLSDPRSVGAHSARLRQRHAAPRDSAAPHAMQKQAGERSDLFDDLVCVVRPRMRRCCHQRDVGSTTTATRLKAWHAPRAAHRLCACRAGPRAQLAVGSHGLLSERAPAAARRVPLISRRRGGARAQTRRSSRRRAPARARILGGGAALVISEAARF